MGFLFECVGVGVTTACIHRCNDTCNTKISVFVCCLFVFSNVSPLPVGAACQVRHSEEPSRLACVELVKCSEEGARLVTSSSVYTCDGGQCEDGKAITCADADCGGDFFGVRQSCLECNIDMCEACVAGGRWATVLAEHPKHSAGHTILRLGTSEFDVALPVAPVPHMRDTNPVLRWNTGVQSVPPETAAVLRFITGRGAPARTAGAPATAKGVCCAVAARLGRSAVVCVALGASIFARFDLSEYRVCARMLRACVYPSSFCAPVHAPVSAPCMRVSTRLHARALVAAPAAEAAAAPAPPTIGGTLREGMLFKTGGETKTWHARWVIIAGPQLVYFKTRQDAVEVGP